MKANVWGFTDQASPAPTVALTSEHGKPQTITATLMPYDGPQGNFTWHVLLPATAAAEEGGKAVQYSLTVTQGMFIYIWLLTACYCLVIVIQ